MEGDQFAIRQRDLERVGVDPRAVERVGMGPRTAVIFREAPPYKASFCGRPYGQSTEGGVCRRPSCRNHAWGHSDRLGWWDWA